MNIFLISNCVMNSAKVFMNIDPRRARKQLLECCQILASVDLIRNGRTAMIKADGNPYKLAHQHHPIVKRCAENLENWGLCRDVAYGLSTVLPGHACSISFQRWNYLFDLNYIPKSNQSDTRLIVCRKTQPVMYAHSRKEYASIFFEYLQDKITSDKVKE